MSAVVLADMERAIKALKPFAYKVLTRCKDDIGTDLDPVGMIFILWKEGSLFSVDYFDMSNLMDPAEKSEEYIIQNFVLRQKRLMTRKDLIKDLVVTARVAYRFENGSLGTTYWTNCNMAWTDHLERALNIEIAEKARGQAEIQKGLDAMSMLVWWFYDKDNRMAMALEDKSFHRKMREMKEKFDEMWGLYSSQDWKEVRKLYR